MRGDDGPFASVTQIIGEEEIEKDVDGTDDVDRTQHLRMCC